MRQDIVYAILVYAVMLWQLEKDEWDSVHFDRISAASDMDKKVGGCSNCIIVSSVSCSDGVVLCAPGVVCLCQADIAAVLISDTEANLCIITPHMTITRSHMEAHIPKKRLTNDDARQVLYRFSNGFEQLRPFPMTR